MRKGYKKTEVGIIPEDWQVAPLFKVCKMKSGESITSANIDEYSEFPCYGGNGLRGFTSRYTHDGKHALIGRQGALCGNVVGVKGKFFASEHAVVVTANSQTNISWLTYVLGDMNLNQYSESSAQPGLSVSKILNLDLALPPTHAEQEAIAEALSDADALIESLETLLAKKRQVKQGAMSELLSGKRRLSEFIKKQGYKQTEVGEIPEDWDVYSLGEIGKFKNGINKGSEAFGQGTPFVNLMDVFGVSSLASTKNLGLVTCNNFERSMYDLRRGDVIFIRSSVKPSGVGLTAVVENDLPETVYSGFLIRFRDSGTIDIGYKRYCFYEERFRKSVIDSSTVSANTNINQVSLKKLSIPLPPTQAEQTAIAEILSDMDAEIRALEEKLSKARAVKAGMMSALLTGRVRLV